MSETKYFRNKNFTKRDYECTNIVAAVVLGNDEMYPAVTTPKGGNWEVDNSGVLKGLMLIQRVAGVEYWGYL